MAIVAACAMLLGACTQDQTRNSPAEADRAAASAEIQERAAKAAGGAGSETIRETLPPFRVAGDSLGGSEPFPWGTAINRAVVTAVFPAETPPRATMQFEKASGSIALTISRANGWQFYVECDARPIGNVPNLWYNWVADVSPGNQARNRATLDPATKKWFFVTPAANAPNNGPMYIVFWAMESQAAPDSEWMFHGCTVLPFKMAREG